MLAVIIELYICKPLVVNCKLNYVPPVFQFYIPRLNYEHFLPWHTRELLEQGINLIDIQELLCLYYKNFKYYQ